MWELDTFSIRVRELELAQGSSRGSQRCLCNLKISAGRLLSHLPGVILHGPLRAPPRIRPSCDHTNFAFDFSIGRIPRATVRILAVPRELPLANEIFYLIHEVETGRGRMPSRVVVQAELVLVLFRCLPLQRRRWSKINLAPRLDKNLLDRGSELLVPIVPWSASSVHPRF